MSQPIYATSLKGHISVKFNQYKKDLNTPKLWTITRSIMSIKPKKILVTYSATRTVLEGNKEVTDHNIRDLVFRIIDGCVEVEQPDISQGKGMDLFLGKCSSYTLPFGTSAMDTGHISVLMPLPFIESGCYHIHAGFSGNLARNVPEDQDYYVLDVSAELYIKQLMHDEVNMSLKRGLKVYPFLIRNPSLIPHDNETSESEGTAISSGDESPPPTQVQGNTQRKRQLNIRSKGMKRQTIRRMIQTSRDNAQMLLDKVQVLQKGRDNTSKRVSEQPGPTTSQDGAHPEATP